MLGRPEGPQHKLARFQCLASHRLGTAPISKLSLGGGEGGSPEDGTPACTRCAWWGCVVQTMPLPASPPRQPRWPGLMGQAPGATVPLNRSKQEQQANFQAILMMAGLASDGGRDDCPRQQVVSTRLGLKGGGWNACVVVLTAPRRLSLCNPAIALWPPYTAHYHIGARLESFFFGNRCSLTLPQALVPRPEKIVSQKGITHTPPRGRSEGCLPRRRCDGLRSAVGHRPHTVAVTRLRVIHFPRRTHNLGVFGRQTCPFGTGKCVLVKWRTPHSVSRSHRTWHITQVFPK